ncbi:MAG: hypothetical protein ABIX01_10370 [Chitinophagaceae bacterium]
MQEDMITPIVPKEILEDKPQQKLLLAIFLEVFVGFFKDIAVSIWDFFKKFILLIWFYLRFIVNPNAEDYWVQREKAIHYSKDTFELILLLTAALIFCIKQGWIVSASTSNTDAYNNDFMQWFMEAVIFLVYAACYFVVLLLLVLLGRLLRKIFSPVESSRVTDLVFVHLNNIFFITAAICSFIIRFDNVASDFEGADKDYEMQHFMIVLFNTFGIAFAIIMFIFFVRLTMINKLPLLKSVLYITLVPAIVWAFLFACELFITAFMAGL